MADIYREHGDIGNSGHGNGEISRHEIQSAIAKAVELRALHAALMLGNSPAAASAAANIRFPSPSPISRHASHLSAQDYPVFTPSYDDEPLPGYQQQIATENRNYSESWGAHTLDETDYRTTNGSSRKAFPYSDSHICPAAEDQNSTAGSCAYNNNSNNTNAALHKASPGPDYYSKSRRNSMGDIQSISSCNNCKPAVIVSTDPDGLHKNGRKSNIVVPLTDSHSSLHPQPRNKGLGLSWLFPNLKKKKNKNKNEDYSPSEEYYPQILKKELMEANESRDAALNEVSGMRSSLSELNQKLEYLETYCEELKKALKQAVQFKISDQLPVEKLVNIPHKSGNGENSMPVSEEVMVEGFLQIVSEARLSVKQFCKTLIGQIEETDPTLIDNLNSLLQPYKLSLDSKYSKAVLYHLEALVNQSLYQDFENPIFQKNGATKILDPQQDRLARFQSFVALRNLSWNEVLRKGTKCYSEEFSKFCDQKMSGIIGCLGCTRPWPEQLLQAFFVAAKCIWLLHLLAFSFNRPLCILRVDENAVFEGNYMEDVFGDRQRTQGAPSRVKVMVMPGFYVLNNVLRCKVLCRYKSVS
ncbi:hypothetical protein ABFS83_14G214300 [Erythranthe nasuta]